MTLDPIILKLSNKLIDFNARPIIVGGYVRDYFMNISSKDVDIEVYNINSIEDIKSILQTFAHVYEVGKIFGVLKIKLENYDFDISLPRIEKKTAKGHKGFKIKTDAYLNFKSAAIRRDFTINAIGYDVKTKKILDPFNGVDDIKKSILKHINDESFIEDPLRILRAVQFVARFNYKLHPNTLKLCKNMVKKNMLNELPKERVFQEFKKLFLKSLKPSKGFKILDKTGALFPEIKILQKNSNNKIDNFYTHTMRSIDAMVKLKTKNEKKDIYLMLAVLNNNLIKMAIDVKSENIFENIISVLNKMGCNKSLINSVLPLTRYHMMPSKLYKQKCNNSAIKKLSTKVNIEELVIVAKADYFGNKNRKNKNRYLAGEWLLKKAKELNVLHEKPQPLILGRDIISLGIKPEKRFKAIIDDAYEAQLDEKFNTKNEAILWLKNYLEL